MRGLHDDRGYGIVVGCYVRVRPAAGPSYHAWVQALESHPRLGTVARLRDKGGRTRWAGADELRVVKPGTMAKARREGQRKTIAHASEQAKRRRRL